jgi:hypothetical protein
MFAELSYTSLRMRDVLLSVIHSFNKETDKKNPIVDTKMDILRRILSQCAILLKIVGKRSRLDVLSNKWAWWALMESSVEKL